MSVNGILYSKKKSSGCIFVFNDVVTDQRLKGGKIKYGFDIDLE